MVDTVTVELERELVSLFRPAFGRHEDRIREYLVLELYRRREISSGKAAELLDMGRAEFIRYSSRLGIPFLDMDNQELWDEIRTVREE